MVDFDRSAVDSPAVRKSSAVELDRTGAEQCGTPSNRAPPSNWETPSYCTGTASPHFRDSGMNMKLVASISSVNRDAQSRWKEDPLSVHV